MITIIKSVINVILFIYSKSYLNLLSQSIEFLPLIWAKPVSPGLTVCLFRISSDINTISLTNCGRGPTNDISPFKILINSGISSRLVFLKNFPNLVNLSSSGNRLPSLSFLLDIVLNLYIVKIFSFLPGRFCLKIAGLPKNINTNIPVIRNIGKVIIIAINDNIISNSLLMYFWYISIILSIRISF